VRKLRQKLDKKQILYGQVDNLIILLAKKYDAFKTEEEESAEIQTEIDANISPDIVLSETFIA